WQFDFDTTGIDGNLYFRVAVFRKDEPQKLTVPTEVRGDIAPSNLDAGSQYAYARVNQDESKPENVEFVNVPKEWPIGKSMKAHVRVRKREESQAPVDQIVFFRGEPAADGKLNPESIIGKGVFDPAKSECFFELPPREKGEVLPLSVKVTTKSGAFAFAAATINFKADYEPGKVLAKLVGHVVRGDLGQPGLEVSLTDEKGNAKGKAKTGGQGKFVFEKVAPGVYFLSASRPSLGLTGRIRVEVPDGTALIDDLTLKLSVK
ncbi:MAG: carboxypeptidase regulatory-like domain-containing protein, partial [Planctomycetes bacterium]|nr:carboxypeptidase regulatory-like domain-containing protein [Planctomycetota bacterium]